MALACLTTSAAAFAPSAALPDLLTLLNGTKISSAEQWPTRRTELKELLQEHILGTLPPTPTLQSAKLLNSTSSATVSSAYVRLAFDANATTVAFDVFLAWPFGAKGPLPTFLTQWNHRGWGLTAVQRGYMTAVYPGADALDVSGEFRAAYPGATFRKILARAFVAKIET